MTVNGPANHEYAAMSYATSISDIDQQISDSLLAKKYELPSARNDQY